MGPTDLYDISAGERIETIICAGTVENIGVWSI